jgi:hypothetical protein
MPLTPEQRTQRARIAVLTRWSREDPKPAMAAANRGFHDRFVKEVDPDGVLPPVERARRADAAKKAHMARLAFRSAQARRKTVQDRGARYGGAADRADDVTPFGGGAA